MSVVHKADPRMNVPRVSLLDQERGSVVLWGSSIRTKETNTTCILLTLCLI